MGLDLDVTGGSLPGVLATMELSEEEADRALGREKAKGPQIKSIRTAHHYIAILVAKGYAYVDVARMTGYTAATVSYLCRSPAFQVLVDHYAQEEKERLLSLQTRTEIVSHQLLDEIQDRLEDDDKREEIPFSALSTTAAQMLDRAGQGPVKKVESKSLQVTINVEKVREEAKRFRFLPAEDRRAALGAGGEGESVGLSADAIFSRAEGGGEL